MPLVNKIYDSLCFTQLCYLCFPLCLFSNIDTYLKVLINVRKYGKCFWITISDIKKQILRKHRKHKTTTSVINYKKNQTCKSDFQVFVWWYWGRLDKQLQYNTRGRHWDPLEQQKGWQHLQKSPNISC